MAESNRAFKEALKLLAKIRTKVQRQTTAMQKESDLAFRLVANSLVDLQKEIERCTTELSAWHSVFWQRTLRTYPSTKADLKDVWILLLSPGESGLPQEERYTGAVLQGGIERSSKLPDPKPEPIRTMDLHTRFQLRVASILEREFPRLSMETLARLIVLVYLCFNLVHESSGELLIGPNSEKLTVGAVYEKLKRQKRRQRIKS